MQISSHYLLATKTEIILFRKKGVDIPDLKINGIKLVLSSEIKYVGITFDEHMNFQSHILTLNAKLKIANNLLATSRHYIPKALLLQIFFFSIIFQINKDKHRNYNNYNY